MQNFVEVHAHFRPVFDRFFPEIVIHSEEICGHFYITQADFNRVFG